MVPSRKGNKRAGPLLVSAPRTAKRLADSAERNYRYGEVRERVHHCEAKTLI